MDRASIIANEEVCKRCHLYTKHCGMLEYPSQCVNSGHFIDGYRKGEKDTKGTLLEWAKSQKARLKQGYKHEWKNSDIIYGGNLALDNLIEKIESL